MVCLFCSSKAHSTVYCNIYISDKGRIEKLRQRNFCELCLKPKHSFKKEKIRCELNQRCYICFFQARHPSFLCPERTKKEKFYALKIDDDLAPRFLQTLKPLEQYSLGFSSQKAYNTNFTALKPLKIKSCAENFDFSPFSDSHILVNEKMCYKDRYNPIVPNLLVEAKTILFLHIRNPIKNFLQIASKNTEVLCLRSSAMEREISLQKLLQNFPNLKEIEISATNIGIDMSWPHVFLDYKNLPNLEKFFMKKYMEFDENFNCETLAAVLRASPNLTIHLHTFSNTTIPNLSKYFSPYPKNSQAANLIIGNRFYKHKKAAI